MEWSAGDMRAESGRLNLEGAVIKNLFASSYPPLLSWQSRLPLTIKDLITICKKKKRMGWGKWKYVSADTLNGRWFCRGTSVRRLWLCLSAVHSHPTANYFYCRRSCADQYRRIDTNDTRRVQYQIIIITDSTLLGRLIQMCVIEQATCFLRIFMHFIHNITGSPPIAGKIVGKKSLIYCCCVAIVWNNHKIYLCVYSILVVIGMRKNPFPT